MADGRAIGVFDSGLGGLTVARELIRELPHEDITYFGDTASYGGYGGESGLSYPGENVHSGLTREDYSPIGNWFTKADAEFMFLSHAECCFLKAEARLKGWGEGGRSAEEYYYEGIRSSMKHYRTADGKEIDDARIEAYLATPGIAWGTATETVDGEGRDISADFMDWLQICSSIVGTNDFRHQIIMQHWLAIPGQGVDAWTLLRRTQELLFEPCFSGYEGFYKYLPYRLKYPTSEVQYNTSECAKACQEYRQPRTGFSGRLGLNNSIELSVAQMRESKVRRILFSRAINACL